MGIALMGDAYGEIMAISDQSTMKELCSMMEDNVWLLDIGTIFKNHRYILWLTPDKATAQGSAVERELRNLRDYVDSRADQSDAKILREIQLIAEDMESVKTQLADIEMKQTAMANKASGDADA